MGVFDSVYLKFEIPGVENNIDTEFQTKSFPDKRCRTFHLSEDGTLFIHKSKVDIDDDPDKTISYRVSHRHKRYVKFNYTGEANIYGANADINIRFTNGVVENFEAEVFLGAEKNVYSFEGRYPKWRKQ